MTKPPLVRCGTCFVAIALIIVCGLRLASAQVPAQTADPLALSSAPPAMAYQNSPVPQFSAEESGWNWNAGADLIVIVPRFESNPAYTRSTVQATGFGPLTQTNRRYEEFHYDYALSPRIWLGAENENGVGGRVRWWQYHQAAPTLQVTNPPIPLGSATLAQTVTSQSPLMAIGPQTGLPTVLSLQQQGVPNTADVMSFGTSLGMNVWDFEGTLSDLEIGRWSFLLSGGLRYAHLNQTYNAFLASDPAIMKPAQFLDSSQSFDGLGPTLAMEARRSWDSLGLTLIGGARAAFLYGTDRHSVTGLNTDLFTQAFGFQSDYSTRVRSIPVIEMELGAERVVPVGSFDWILRGSVLTQLWPIGSGPHANGNMALIGFTAGTGLRF